MKRQSKGQSKSKGSAKQRRSHLSPANLKELRAALEAKLAELRREVQETLSAGTHSEEVYSDPMEAAERSEEEEELLSLAGQERTLLSEVERALAKMDNGTYGVSDLSGQPIPLERLRAVPWARFTADEEAEVEQRRREARERAPTRS